jgi:hypothetical protein
MCSGSVSSSCSTCGTRCVTLVTNTMISHWWGMERIVITTNRTYPWSVVTQIIRNGQPSHGGDRTTCGSCCSYFQITCLHVFRSVLWCPLWFPYKNYVRFVLTPICFVGVHALFMLFVFIYVYWCPIQVPYQMMFVSFNNNTTGVTCGAGKKTKKTSMLIILIYFNLNNNILSTNK